MPSLNRVTIIGHVGRDPECRTVASGGKVANFSVAVSEKWKDKSTGEKKEKTEWVRIVVWGPTAEFVSGYVNRGALVYVCGKLETRKWVDKDGAEKYTTEVVVQGFGSEVLLLSGKKDGGGGEPDERGRGVDEGGNEDGIPF